MGETGSTPLNGPVRYRSHPSCGCYRFTIAPSNGKAHCVILQKNLPVITSILIILLVAFLRERSRTLSAILATMPINMLLALWIVVGTPDITQEAMVQFVRSLIIGLIPSIVWLIVVFVMLRNGWTLLPAVLTGYGIWGALIAVAFVTGVLTVQR
jgi:hypothetical protein